MDRSVGDELGVKCRADNATLSHEDGIASARGEDLDADTERDDLGGSYEYGLEPIRSRHRRLDILAEAVDLPTVGVAPDLDIEKPDTCLLSSLYPRGEEYQPGARAEYFHASVNAPDEDFHEPEANE